MSEPKRTPGPWVANRFENGELFVAADGLTVCKVTKCVGMTGVITQAEAEENARLIALSPELLQTLKEVVPQLEYMASGMTHAPWKTKDAQECLERVLAVIAKTEGKA